MKSIYKLAAAAVLALSSAGLASAAAPTGSFYVTGSTAYRVSDVLAECVLCGATSASGTSTAEATYWNSSAGSITGANYSVVQNSSGSLKFYNFFNGSVAGDQAVFDASTQLPYPNATDFPPTQITLSNAGLLTEGTAGGTFETVPSTSNINLANPTATGAFGGFATTAQKPAIAFSDVSFNTANQIMSRSGDHAASTPTGANSFVVGVVPFVFVSNGTTGVTSELAGLSMDPQKFTYTWGSGGVTPLSVFTGNPNDNLTYVYPMGRDADSGTRSTALAETGYGLNGSGNVFAAVAQFYPFASSTAYNNDSNTSPTGVIGNDSTLTNPTIYGLNAVPAESIDLYNMGIGDGGYNSGGNLAKGMTTAFVSGYVDPNTPLDNPGGGTVSDPASTNSVMMTYLGVSDATTALVTGTGTNRQLATIMAYCGVTWYPYPLSSGNYPDGSTTGSTNVTGANNAKIYNGKYSFWSYENEYCTSAGNAAASALASQLNGGLDSVSSNGVTFSQMAVTRGADGQNVQ